METDPGMSTSMLYFCVQTRQFRSTNLLSVLPGPIDVNKIYSKTSSRARRQEVMDERESRRLMAEHMERSIIQADYANHWASADQIPLVLRFEETQVEVASILEGDQMRGYVSASLSLSSVVVVYGPLTKIDTESGIQFMIMDLDGIVAGC